MMKQSGHDAGKKSSGGKPLFQTGADSSEFRKARAGPEPVKKRPGVKASSKALYARYKNAETGNAAQEPSRPGADAGVEYAKSTEESRKANEDFFRRHETDEERETEYASGREEARARWKRRQQRQHPDRERNRSGFTQPDGDFAGRTGFLEDAGAETSQGKRLDRLEQKAGKAAEKNPKGEEKAPPQEGI